MLSTNPATTLSQLEATSGQPPSILHLAFHAVFGMLIGTLISVIELDALFLIFPILTAVVAFTCWRNLRPNQASSGRLAIATLFAAMMAVILAAFVAPVKDVEQRLNQVISLPAENLTLGDLTRLIEKHELDEIHFAWPKYSEHANLETIIHFRTIHPTVREFITAVEQQSKLRMHKICCGNGWTVLWGGYCGLYVIAPDET